MLAEQEWSLPMTRTREGLDDPPDSKLRRIGTAGQMGARRERASADGEQRKGQETKARARVVNVWSCRPPRESPVEPAAVRRSSSSQLLRGYG